MQEEMRRFETRKHNYRAIAKTSPIVVANVPSSSNFVIGEGCGLGTVVFPFSSVRGQQLRMDIHSCAFRSICTAAKLAILCMKRASWSQSGACL